MGKYYFYNGELYSIDELRHHGIKGQKWGVRRYQNADGTLTPAGKKRKTPGVFKSAVRTELNTLRHPLKTIKFTGKLGSAAVLHYPSAMRYMAKSVKAIMRKDTRKKLLDTINSSPKSIDDIISAIDRDFFYKHRDTKIEDIVVDPETATVAWSILMANS